MNAKTKRRSVAVVKKQPQEIAQPVQPMTQKDHYLAMVSKAMSEDKMDMAERAMEMMRDYEREEAKKAYFKAVSLFKANAPIVIKDLTNKQYNSKYVSKGNLVNTTSRVLSEYGLSTHWDVLEQTPESMTVACILSHELGHSESVDMFGPYDTSGSKNPIQQIKSTKTYLEVATFEAVTGVATSEHGDDDGNGTVAPPVIDYITEEQVLTITAYIDDNGIDKGTFMKWLNNGGAQTIESIHSQNFDKVMSILKKMAGAQTHAK